MRIIAGKYKNRTVQTPPGDTTRPLLSRIRKSLFGILDPYLPEARVLDCYAGTGIVALESFSRGASFVLSIEQDKHAMDVAHANQQKICPDADYRLMRGDVLEMLPRIAAIGESFDIIGVMPPFHEDLVNRTLGIIDLHPELLKPDTVVFAQHELQDDVKLEWNNLEHLRTKKYGRNLFQFFMPFEKEESKTG